MAAEALQPVYLLAGTDRPKVVRALRRLRSHFPEESVDVLTAPPTSAVEAAAACNALGLFGGGGRLVVVEGVENWGEPDVKAIEAYLADASPGAVLALWAHQTPKSGALAALVAKRGQVLSYDVPRPRSPSAWVVAEFKRLGLDVDADAARALVDIVGDDVLTLVERDREDRDLGRRPADRRERHRGDRGTCAGGGGLGGHRRLGSSRSPGCDRGL